MTPTTDGPKTAPSDATAVPFTLPGTVPAELAALPQWVAWWWEERDGKPAKSPLNPHTGAYAPTTDPATWGRLQDALRFCRKHSSAAGVGFVFTKDDRHAGFDLDKCRDPETGEIAPCAQANRRLSEQLHRGLPFGQRRRDIHSRRPAGRGERLLRRDTYHTMP